MQFTKKLSLATLSLASIFALAGCDQFKGDSSTIAKGDGIEVKQEEFAFRPDIKGISHPGSLLNLPL